MKIGEIVKSHIFEINNYCEKKEHQEFINLSNEIYCKESFDINYPFYKEVSLISQNEHSRFWSQTYIIRGKTVRVTNDWYERNRSDFISYIISKKFVLKEEFEKENLTSNKKLKQPKINIVKPTKNSRFKGNAIGNSSNALVRNILSNLGDESFNQDDWQETINYFDNKCAYCNEETKLVMEHAVPINKKHLGEHRLGNIIPSCKKCNDEKHNKNFIEFLNDDIDKIKKIQLYMDNKNYVPLTGNEQIEMILEMAYNEVATVSNRYIAILNELFSNKTLERNSLP
jgi:hypothetical protein